MNEDKTSIIESLIICSILEPILLYTNYKLFPFTLNINKLDFITQLEIIIMVVSAFVFAALIIVLLVLLKRENKRLNFYE